MTKDKAIEEARETVEALRGMIDALDRAKQSYVHASQAVEFTDREIKKMQEYLDTFKRYHDIKEEDLL